ncbi:MAG TPA: glycoside hydrolase family 127 protein, partial [Prolixibacteraceae bacterium]|nr:glycoside hydrolase family 127 protein [Prolixibacteraceae bacterium]
IVNGSASKEFNLMVRVPGWAANSVVPFDLYHFTNTASSPVEFNVNGKTTKPQLINGYACFSRNWKKGDRVEMILPMDVRKVVASDQVDADKGKIAYQRGPLVYCFEDKDNNNGWMFDTYVAPDAKPEASFSKDLLGGVETIAVNGFRVDSKEKAPEAVSLKAIPYYAWNNRGAANMFVWMPASAGNVCSKEEQGKEMEAKAFASSDWAPGLNDGFEPHRSSDIDKPFFNWWNKEAKDSWVEYRWDKPVSLSQASVYWLNVDHYDGNYRAPKSWSLQYKNPSGKWMSVKTADSYEVHIDKYNTVHFEEVATKALRLNVEFQSGNSAGILAWKVK